MSDTITDLTAVRRLIAALRAAGWRRCKQRNECDGDRCWHRGDETVTLTYGLFGIVLRCGGLQANGVWTARHGVVGLHRLAEAAGVLDTPPPGMVADGCGWCRSHGYMPGQQLTHEGMPVGEVAS